MTPKDYIGLDLGRARTGLARASAHARLAEPLQSMPTEQVASWLHQLNKDKPIEALVVGLPRGMKGQETDQTAWVRQQAEHLKKEVGLTIYGQDEALTTKMAETRRFRGQNLHDTDAVAAAIILQDFLDGPDSDRIVL